jgi:hypothetical protein
MQSDYVVRIYLLTAITVASFLITWEYYWRSRGFGISFNDDKVMWAAKRKLVYAPNDKATVFIGSSRIKFDLDIPTWENLTGEQAIQLAFVGTSPRPVLHHLARDRKFKGKVVISVMEPSFFAMDSIRRERFAQQGINYFDQETPAQKASAPINFLLESNLVFLEEGKFGLNALLDHLKLPLRDGIVVRPMLPKEFSFSTADRQSVLTPMFMSDEQIQKTVIDIWRNIGSSNKIIPVTGDALEAYFNELKSSIDKIKSRGGSVVFVRPPSSSFNRERENRQYPRALYWDRLLKHTKTAGHHYEDYPETAGLVCPDGSHLSPTDAIAYTEHLVKILKARPK